jgi:hypothetical protein
MSSARAPSASSSTALFPSASPSHQPEEGDAGWQKASILSGVLGAFRMVRKEAESHNGLAAPQARKLPAPMTRDQSILRIQAYVRGRKTRARARATLTLAKERAVTGGAARASPPSEELHGPVNESQAAVGSAEGLAEVVVTIDDAPPDEAVSLAENTRVPQARAPRLAPKPPRSSEAAQEPEHENTRVLQAQAPRLAPKHRKGVVTPSVPADEPRPNGYLPLALSGVALGCIGVVIVLFIAFFTNRDSF